MGQWMGMGIIVEEFDAVKDGLFRDLVGFPRAKDRPMPQSELEKRGFAKPRGK